MRNFQWRLRQVDRVSRILAVMQAPTPMRAWPSVDCRYSVNNYGLEPVSSRVYHWM